MATKQEQWEVLTLVYKRWGSAFDQHASAKEMTNENNEPDFELFKAEAIAKTLKEKEYWAAILETFKKEWKDCIPKT